MGNRAVITTSKALDVSKSGDLGIYLHWNGGRDSVEGFLKYCELKGYCSPSQDNYGWARLCQVISNFFGGSNSIGIDSCSNLDCDNWDNGVYIIDKWEIVDRQFFDGQEQDNHDIIDMLLEIDKAQPEKEQLGEEFLRAETVSTAELKIGDVVYIFDPIYSKYNVHKVVGFGEDKYCNGTNVLGMPYVDLYLNDGSYANNINNYIQEKEIKRLW